MIVPRASFIIGTYQLINAQQGEVSFSMKALVRAPDVDWIRTGLPKSNNLACIDCAYQLIIFGVVIPFLWEVEESFPDEDQIQVTIAQSGITFWTENGEKPLLSINRFATYCSDQTSSALQARLDITIYTNDDISTSHVFDALVPGPRIRDVLFNRKVVFSPEVTQLLENEMYNADARRILDLLMTHLCVGRIRLFLRAKRIINAMYGR
mgnify:CR=1 FL=1